MDKNDNIVKDGSNPCRTARFAEQNEHSGITDTALTQETAESEDKVKFPKPVKDRGKVLATKAEAKRWFAVKGEDALDVEEVAACR